MMTTCLMMFGAAEFECSDGRENPDETTKSPGFSPRVHPASAEIRTSTQNRIIIVYNLTPVFAMSPVRAESTNALGLSRAPSMPYFGQRCRFERGPFHIFHERVQYGRHC